MSMTGRERVRSFREQGWFVVPRFLVDAERAELRRACDDALSATRTAAQETGHTTPRISLLSEGGILSEQVTRVTGLLASSRVCALLSGLSRAGETDAPRLRAAHYYHEQTRHDWDGDWHRDSQEGRPDPEIERAVVERSTWIHFRVALEADDRLEIVPGSHARWDTPDELRIRRGPRRNGSDMPNVARIVLGAGEACVFHAWSIHRATYRTAPVRRTIDAVYAFSSPGQAFP
jgi:Phytanoyl-CoA dioxygenase (PhyH)